MAEVHAQVAIDDEVVGEVVEDPMAQGGKGADADHPPIVIEAVDGPLEAGQQVGEEVMRREVAAHRQEEVREQLVVEKVLGRDLGNDARW